MIVRPGGRPWSKGPSRQNEVVGGEQAGDLADRDVVGSQLGRVELDHSSVPGRRPPQIDRGYAIDASSAGTIVDAASASSCAVVVPGFA